MEMKSEGISETEIAQRVHLMQQDILNSTALALKEHFVLQKISEVEKIEIDDDDLNDEIERMADQNRESPRRLRARLEKDDLLEALAAEMIERKALDLILDSRRIRRRATNRRRSTQRFDGRRPGRRRHDGRSRRRRRSRREGDGRRESKRKLIETMCVTSPERKRRVPEKEPRAAWAGEQCQ